VRYLAFILALTVSSIVSAEETLEPSSEAPEPSRPYAWEFDVYGAYGRLAYPGVETASTVSSYGGPSFAATVAYRGPHFTHPFFDVSYIPILSAKRGVNVFEQGTGVQTLTADSSAHALGFVIGGGWEFYRMRARVGFGLYDQIISTRVTGGSDSITQLGLGFLGSLSVLVVQAEPFALGIEGRLVALQAPFNGIYQLMWSAGITGRWDFARGH
jgi:hypothetical protein